MRKRSLATVFQHAVAITMLLLAAPVVAQAPPTAQNIIPDAKLRDPGQSFFP